MSYKKIGGLKTFKPLIFNTYYLKRLDFKLLVLGSWFLALNFNLVSTNQAFKVLSTLISRSKTLEMGQFSSASFTSSSNLP